MLAAAPDGWVERQQGTARVFDSQTVANTSVIAFAEIASGDARATLEAVERGFAENHVCPASPPVATADRDVIGLTASTPQARCVLLAVTTGQDSVTIVVGIAMGTNAMAAGPLLAATRGFLPGQSERVPPDTAATARAPDGTGAPRSVMQARAQTVPVPLGAVSRLSMRMAMVNGLPMPDWTNVIWFLFPGGIATDCARPDPASLVLTLVALRAQKSCTGARWRRAGGRIELQLKDGDAWTHDRVFERAPAPKSYRLDLDAGTVGGSGFGSDIGGMGATHVLTGGQFRLTRAGRIEASTSSSVSFNSTTAFAAAGRDTPGLRGTYVIDGYLLHVRTDEGATITRYIVFDKGTWPTYHYVHFEGTQYWLPGD